MKRKTFTCQIQWHLFNLIVTYFYELAKLLWLYGLPKMV